MRRTRVVGLAIVFVLLAGACGGSGNGTPPAPTPITVYGQILMRGASEGWRPPAVGVSVVVEGHAQVVTSGAGEFTVTDVVPPYTVTILASANAGAVVYVGLTRSDPVLLGPLPSATAPQVTTAEGNVTGGIGWPTPLGYETQVAYGNAARGPLDVTAVDTTAGYYEVRLSWEGGSPITVTGAAIQTEVGADGAPTSYHGFRTTTLDVSNGVPHFGADIALEPVPQALTTGTLTIPAGYSSGQTLLEAEHVGGPKLTLWMGTYGSGPISLLTPGLPLSTLRLVVASTAPTGEDVYISRVVQSGDSGLSLQVPEVVRQLAPSDGATLVTDSTLFQVSAHANRVYSLTYEPVAPSDGPYLFLTTSASSWTLPDLSAYGVTIPAAATYEWRVEGLGPATVDDLCDDVFFKSRASFYSTYAGHIEFTTAP